MNRTALPPESKRSCPHRRGQVIPLSPRPHRISPTTKQWHLLGFTDPHGLATAGMLMCLSSLLECPQRHLTIYKHGRAGFFQTVTTYTLNSSEFYSTDHHLPLHFLSLSTMGQSREVMDVIFSRRTWHALRRRLVDAGKYNPKILQIQGILPPSQTTYSCTAAQPMYHAWLIY